MTTLTDNNLPTKLMWWSITRQTCVIVLIVLTVLLIFATYVRAFTWIVFCMKSSVELHNKMFNAITRTTMYFFNTNSSGKK